MLTKTITIDIPSGLDPSSIAMFIQIASQYESKIHLEVDEKKINAKSIMGMMTLGLNQGDELTVIAEGDDREEAIEHITKYLNNTL